MNSPNGKRIGGQTFNVGDCLVWAEINYLDSSSDYREFLLRDPAQRISSYGGERRVLSTLIKTADEIAQVLFDVVIRHI
jgi:hypothetical protein